MTITLTREEAQQVLDALEKFPYGESIKTILRNKLIAPDVMINGLTEQETAETMSVRGLAQPEPEPVAWKVWTVHNHIFFSVGVQTFQINDVLEHEPEVSAKEFSEWLATQLRHALTQLSNTAPPQREWQGLTDEERNEFDKWLLNGVVGVIHAIEAKLKEKNT